MTTFSVPVTLASASRISAPCSPVAPSRGPVTFFAITTVVFQITTIFFGLAYFSPSSAPIKNGTTADLTYARNINGQSVNVNPNFGKPISYQAPIHGRLGLRLLF